MYTYIYIYVYTHTHIMWPQEKRVPSQLPPIPPQASRNPWNPRLVGRPRALTEGQTLRSTTITD